MVDKKLQHIELALESQTGLDLKDDRFFYEPLLSAHPVKELGAVSFLGKQMRFPMWVSSMTGGTALAKKINFNIAAVCHDFGMGMGLGSCRRLLYDSSYFDQYDVRSILGSELPLFANLGIAQIDEMIRNDELARISGLIDRLQADGLVIHVNPMQEWMQPEGNVIKRAPVEIIEDFLSKIKIKVIVKEVGQGMGPESLRRLVKLPLEAIEFGAYGGTNFFKVELLRNESIRLPWLDAFSYIGHDVDEMLTFLNQISDEEKDINCKQFIISGGIKNFLDGYYFINKCKFPAIYGQASMVLKYAKDSYETLHNYLESQVKGYMQARAFLRVK